MRITILIFCVAFAQAEIRLAEHTIATGLKGGYQVVAVDLNHDGKTDLIALASGLPDLAWFENPGSPDKPWTRHVLATNLPKLINCAAEDIDGDGIPEIVVAWEFANEASKSIGKVGLLQHEGDPRNPWHLTPIDELTTSHRIRWADLDGSGKKVALNAALTGAKAAPPNYAGRAPLVFYRPGKWTRELLSDANEGVQHGIFVTRWNPEDKCDSILTASFSGIHLIRWEGGKWQRTELSKGDSAPCPKCGASDVTVGKLGGHRFLAAIEPWHGNRVVFYRESKGAWERLPIDDSLIDGHTILAADFDGDGNDEIVVGFRQGAKAVNLYKFDGKGWQKQVVDESGLGPASCTAADLSGSGKQDLVCIGSAGAALKRYENLSLRN